MSRLGSAWRRARKVAIVAGASMASAAMAIAAMNLSDIEAPPPLYTTEDLPAEPPAQNNGWHLALDAGGRMETNPDTREAVASVLAGDKRPHDVTASLALRRGERASHQQCLDAFGKPRFVDVCPVGEDCAVFPAHRCHEAVVRDALFALGTGDDERAAELTAMRLRSASDHASTARSFVSHAIALAGLTDALRLTQVVIAHAPRTRAELRREVIALDEELAEVPPAGQYLNRVAILDQVATGEHGLAMRFFTDRGETLGLLNRVSARERKRSDEIGWWVDNPVGDYLVDHLARPHDDGSRTERYRQALMSARIAVAPAG